MRKLDTPGRKPPNYLGGSGFSKKKMLAKLKYKLMGGRKKPRRHWVKKYSVEGHYRPKGSHITKFKGSGKLSGTGRTFNIFSRPGLATKAPTKIWQGV